MIYNTLYVIILKDKQCDESVKEVTLMEHKTVREAAALAKAGSYTAAALPGERRNAALKAIAAALDANSAEIFSANLKDMEGASAEGLPGPIVKRLKFDEHKLRDAVSGINDLIKLPDPIGKTLSRRQLDQGLVLHQISCPIGVIGVIFESRPDALVQISALCLKSGNCAVLKGGSEAKHTNRALFDIIHAAGTAAGVPAGFLTLLESRSEIDELLGCHEFIDLIIPRGSNAFVRYIMDNSDIPVMGHSDGVCHVYADKAVDPAKAIPIIRDSKIQYPAACNATETVLVHREIADSLLPPLADDLISHGVSLRVDDTALAIIRGGDSAAVAGAVERATDDDFKNEYLDMVLNVKVVGDITEAIDHINAFGSHHTDCIVTEDDEAAAVFMGLVDSAGVYRNCSTRFADGFRYGLGAEVGISTGKLHARGPVGLEGLQTYKYLLNGDGQIVDDYAEGRKTFHFKDI